MRHPVQLPFRDCVSKLAYLFVCGNAPLVIHSTAGAVSENMCTFALAAQNSQPNGGGSKMGHHSRQTRLQSRARLADEICSSKQNGIFPDPGLGCSRATTHPRRETHSAQYTNANAHTHTQIVSSECHKNTCPHVSQPPRTRPHSARCANYGRNSEGN